MLLVSPEPSTVNERLDAISVNTALVRNSSCVSTATRVTGVGAWKELDE